MGPTLSVVTPFYNVEPYLAACLDSLTGQTFENFEALLVDDGSADGSSEIAEEYARKDPRFRIFRQRNRGPGAARNVGVGRARGDYLAFLDGDDLVAANAYELLLGSLAESGSDLSCGGVERFDSSMFWPSPLHQGIFSESCSSTHIRQRESLLGDRTVWNKVYSRSFWDRYAFRFPEHPYEDGLVSVSAHVLARSVDVIPGPVYYWRRRDAGEPSITQRTLAPENLDGRIRQIRAISAFLKSTAPSLKDAYDAAALQHDVIILLSATPHVSELQREEILTFAQNFHGSASTSTLDLVGEEDIECYRLLSVGRVGELFQRLRARESDALL